MGIIGECLDRYILKNAKNINFLDECYSENTYNKGNLVSLNELNAKTLIDKHSKDGYVIVSPCRGGTDFGLDISNKQQKEKLAQINKQRIKDFVGILKSGKFSFTPTYGGYIENQGTADEENVYERSFVIYNRLKDGSVGDFNELKNFALEMGKRYNQDSVFIKAPNETPKSVTPSGSIDMEFGDDIAFNDLQQAYFTDLHKNTHKTIGNNTKPTRFSFLECYINPSPQCMGERMKRSYNGEIFLSR